MMRLRLFLIIPGVLFIIALLAFEFGLRKGREQAEKPREGDVMEAPRSDQELISILLAQDLGERRFSFPVVVQASSGKKMSPMDKDQVLFKELSAVISRVANETLALMNAEESPVRTLRRINEASRYFEDSLRVGIDLDPAFSCAIPTTAAGRQQRSGYPDLRIEHLATGVVVYLDPKLYEEKNRDSTLRSFYFEPRKGSGKIQEEASHLLLGIVHDGREGAWTFSGWELLDLSLLEVRLKAEFQASNRDLYRHAALLLSSEDSL